MKNITIQTDLSEEELYTAIRLAQTYLDLLNTISNIADELENCHDKFGKLLEALIAVKMFLEISPVIKNSNSTAPIGAIATILRDLQIGAKPNLLLDKFNTEKTKPKEPTHTVVMSATAAACLKFLMQCKHSQLEAANFVRTELNNLKIAYTRENGPIQNKTIINWLKTMQRKNNESTARALYMDVLSGMEQRFRSTDEKVDAQTLVKTQLRELVISGTVVPKRV